MLRLYTLHDWINNLLIMKYIIILFLLSSCSPVYHSPVKKDKVDMVRLKEASMKAAEEVNNELKFNEI